MVDVVQIWCGDKSGPFKNYEYCMDQVREMFPNNYERIFINNVPNEHPIVTTDTLRNKLACERPNMLYVDDDIIFHKEPVFEKLDGQPYFGTAHNRVNHCIFYVNDNTNFFKNIFIEKEKRKLETVFGWPVKIIRTKKVNIIDSNIYLHFRFTSTAREAIQNEGYTNNPWPPIGSYEDEDDWE